MNGGGVVDDRRILRTGIIGSVIAALCCFTPVLVIAFGVLGVSAWLAWADFVLFPALAIFLGLAAYGYYRTKRRSAP